VSKFLLYKDPILKAKRVFYESEDQAVIHSTFDVTEVIEENKRQYAGVDERARWATDWNHVARIPMPIYAELEKQGIAKDEGAFLRWLDDADQRAFRTRPGKLSR
jgi:hypothetical protein